MLYCVLVSFSLACTEHTLHNLLVSCIICVVLILSFMKLLKFSFKAALVHGQHMYEKMYNSVHNNYYGNKIYYVNALWIEMVRVTRVARVIFALKNVSKKCRTT